MGAAAEGGEGEVGLGVGGCHYGECGGWGKGLVVDSAEDDEEEGQEDKFGKMSKMGNAMTFDVINYGGLEGRRRRGVR